MKQMPKVSVVIPFYNAESTLLRALQSLKVQSFDDFECVLVDNNSTDKSYELAVSFASEDSRFKIIKERQQGVMYASNAGCKIAIGEFVSRMDADDEMYSKKLELQIRFLKENLDYGVVSGLVDYISHKENTEGFARYVDWVNSVQSYEEILKKRFVESPIVNPTAMWRKEVGSRYGLYKAGDFPEDYEMWLRWLQEGVVIGKIDQPVLKWYDSDLRLTRTNSIYSDEAFFTIKTHYLGMELKKINKFYPNVVIWGASKVSRKWIGLLKDNGIEIEYYIDTKRNRQIDKHVIYYEQIPDQGSCFVLVYMKHQKIRQQIHDFLISKNYKEGEDFLLLS